MRAVIIAAKRDHPTWGPKKLRPWLLRQNASLGLPSLTTMHTILKESNLVNAQGRRRHRLRGAMGTPFEGDDRANGVWTVDFKGQFKLRNGKYCFPLTVCDGFSRMLLCCEALPGVHWKPVRTAFEGLFETFGVPEFLRSDNGNPFASTGVGRLTQLSVWWLDQGIGLQRITPGKPQENGRHERMHRTLKAETARPPAHSMKGQQDRFDDFRDEYNEDRPNEALAQRAPSELYECSSRAYVAVGRGWEYPAHYETRRVKTHGEIRWRGETVFLSEPLRGRDVGLFETEADCWKVVYRDVLLGILDTRDPGTPRVIRPSDARGGVGAP
jgi:transposase InsO family protein